MEKFATHKQPSWPYFKELERTVFCVIKNFILVTNKV